MAPKNSVRYDKELGAFVVRLPGQPEDFLLDPAVRVGSPGPSLSLQPSCPASALLPCRCLLFSPPALPLPGPQPLQGGAWGVVRLPQSPPAHAPCCRAGRPDHSSMTLRRACLMPPRCCRWCAATTPRPNPSTSGRERRRCGARARGSIAPHRRPPRCLHAQALACLPAAACSPPTHYPPRHLTAPHLLPRRDADISDDIEPAAWQPVGNYAVQITWPDGFSQVSAGPGGSTIRAGGR